jgi:hypothetical protein
MANSTSRLLASFMACSLLGLSACNGDTSNIVIPEPSEPIEDIVFSHTKLEEVTFNHFLKTEEGLYAATSAGIYQLKDDQWKNLTASEQWEVFDLEAVGAGHYLASIKQEDNFYLVESLDSGITWSFVESDFGHTEDDGGVIIAQSLSLDEKIQALEYDLEIGMLYGTGFHVLAVSGDYGRTWAKLTGEWQGFAKGYAALTIDLNSFKVWFGGQNAVEQSQLLSFDLTLQETKTHTSMTDMNSEPGTVKNIRFHPNDPNTIYAAGEPGIISSTDGGETWEEFYFNDESRFYYGLLINPEQPETMYTSGWNKAFFEPQPFYLERTTDGGENWEKIEYVEEADIFGGVWSMYADYGQEESTLYFGLYKGGVMTVKVKN